MKGFQNRKNAAILYTCGNFASCSRQLTRLKLLSLRAIIFKNEENSLFFFAVCFLLLFVYFLVLSPDILKQTSPHGILAKSFQSTASGFHLPADPKGGATVYSIIFKTAPH